MTIEIELLMRKVDECAFAFAHAVTAWGSDCVILELKEHMRGRMDAVTFARFERGFDAGFSASKEAA